MSRTSPFIITLSSTEERILVENSLLALGKRWTDSDDNRGIGDAVPAGRSKAVPVHLRSDHDCACVLPDRPGKRHLPIEARLKALDADGERISP
jgi:hypothetical protein